MALDQTKTQAKLYRMVMDAHTCPYGLKSKDLLERQGFEVEDHHLETREQTDAFMALCAFISVSTSPKMSVRKQLTNQ